MRPYVGAGRNTKRDLTCPDAAFIEPELLQKVAKKFCAAGNLFHADLVYTNKTTRGVGG
jgi:hypothetical protein